MELTKIKLVIWDWYKTLSNKHLYASLEKTNPGAYEIIQDYFRNENSKLDSWARGEISYKQMHIEFSKLTNIPAKVFDESLLVIRNNFDIDQKILPFVEKFKELNIIQVIATDNFDIWDEFFLPQYSQYLNKYFIATYNSSNFRILRIDQGGEFLKTILKTNNIKADETLLIDDNLMLCDLFEKLGGTSLWHSSITDLKMKLSVLTGTNN